MLRSREFEGASCFCPAAVRTLFHPIVACCKEIVSSLSVSQGSGTVRVFCDILGGHTFVQLSLSLRWHVQ